MHVSHMVAALVALMITLVTAPTNAAQPTTAPARKARILPEKETLSFAYGRTRVVQYKFDGVPFKPYVNQLRSPAGVNVLLDSPEDHKHHHGLMFAVGANGVDFWAETPECGKQIPQMMKFQADLLEFGTPLLWKDAKDQAILAENRMLRLHPTPGVTLTSWTSTLSSRPGGEAVKLTGSHYFGLGMRFIRSMDKTGKWITPGGKLGAVVRGDERLTPGKWCAYTARADGKEVTVAMFDSPKNIRPALWFTMADPFAYVSATINLWKEPLELKDPMTLRYGIAVWDGEVGADQIEAMWAQWSKTQE